ncbi:MAG: class I SAM-dependent methyltransferase [Bacteroidia bacterium]
MEENELKGVAAQLRKPEGEYALQIAERMNTGNALMNLNTIKSLPLKENQTVVEIGMGNGLFVKYVLELAENISYFGCDYSPEMVDESCRINAEQIKAGSVKFIHTHAHALPFAESSVDCIFTVNTLYFWDDYSKVFNELKRVLRKEGVLTLSIRPRSSMEKYPFTQYGFRLFSKEEAFELLEEHGWTVLDFQEIEEDDQDILGVKRPKETLIIRSQIK